MEVRDTSFSPTGEAAAVLAWGGAGDVAEVVSEVRRCAEPALVADVIDGRVRGLEEFAGVVHACGVEPLHRSGPGLGSESTLEGAQGKMSVGGELSHRQRVSEVAQGPFLGRAEIG